MLTVVALIGSLNSAVITLFVPTAPTPFGGLSWTIAGAVVSAPGPVEKVAELRLFSNRGSPSVFLIPLVIATTTELFAGKAADGTNVTRVFGPRSLAPTVRVPLTGTKPIVAEKVAAETVFGSSDWLNFATIRAFVPTTACVFAGERAITIGCGATEPAVASNNKRPLPVWKVIARKMVPLSSTAAAWNTAVAVPEDRNGDV